MRKQVCRQSQDRQRTKNLNQDERTNTMSDLWHPLWSERGLPGDGLNTCTGTATDTHRQVVGLLPMLQMNSVTSLSRSSVPSFPTLFLLSSFPHSRVGLNLQQCKPIFHPLTPTHPTLPLHFRNGCGNTSTEHTDGLQSSSGAEGRLQTTVSFYWYKQLFKSQCAQTL